MPELPDAIAHADDDSSLRSARGTESANGGARPFSQGAQPNRNQPGVIGNRVISKNLPAIVQPASIEISNRPRGARLAYRYCFKDSSRVFRFWLSCSSLPI